MFISCFICLFSWLFVFTLFLCQLNFYKDIFCMVFEWCIFGTVYSYLIHPHSCATKQYRKLWVDVKCKDDDDNFEYGGEENVDDNVNIKLSEGDEHIQQRWGWQQSQHQCQIRQVRWTWQRWRRSQRC